MRELIKQIKKKKELASLDSGFVKRHLEIYLSKNPKTKELLKGDLSVRSAKYKKIIKDLRAELRRVYGLFRVEEQSKERRDLLKNLIKLNAQGNIGRILETHSSTKERLPYYQELYDKIFEITGKPQKIVDLGCGINPFSIPYMNLSKLEYYAYDLSEEEIGLLQEFFAYLSKKNKNFMGKAAVIDILSLVRMKKVDICFLFKMTDVLDRGKGHKVTENVITKINSKYVVVSFPTITMSGKKMNYPRRKWIELLCNRLGYKYEVIEYPNEIFYVINRSI